MVGGNLYDRFGTGESLEVSAQRGHSRKAIIHVQDQGSTRTAIHISGAVDSPHFRIRYIYWASFGAVEVTKAVEPGTFQLKNVPPGSHRILKLIVIPGGNAAASESDASDLDAWSDTDSEQRDRVIFKLDVQYAAVRQQNRLSLARPDVIRSRARAFPSRCGFGPGRRLVPCRG